MFIYLKVSLRLLYVILWCQRLSFPLASLILSPLFSLGLDRDSLNRLIVLLATTPSYYTGALLFGDTCGGKGSIL